MLKITTNPDVELANEIYIALAKNDGYCPCKLEKTEETKCMCSEFKQVIAAGEEGTCHCGLYVTNLTLE